MNPDQKLELSLADLLTLATEHWRLSVWLSSAGASAGTARHSVRRIGDVLARCGVEVRSMDGQPFDPGLAVNVVDTIDDPAKPAGTDTVDETVSPMVIWRGNVVRTAEVVVRRGCKAG